jgi:hypothetical protein
VPTLLHFTATWAEAICGPHRAEVAQAARVLGWDVQERDIDRDGSEAKAYGVLNVPAVAVEGQSDRLPLVGARSASSLVAELSHRPL